MKILIRPTKRKLLIEELNKRDFPETPISGNATYFLAKMGDQVVGWCGVYKKDSERAEIYRTGVAAEYRNLGIKRKMVRAMERWAVKQGCVVMLSYCSTDNVASANSLISSGYKLYIPDSYADGEGDYHDWMCWKKRLIK